MKALLAFAALAASSPAPAAELPKGVPGATWHSDAKPPARFQGNVSATLRIVPRGAVMQMLCGNPDPRLMACATGDVITMPSPCIYPGYYAQLLCHEVGHVNGWPGYHGD